MANTGVLPFIRGLDLTKNKLEQEFFPDSVEEMVGLRWIRLTDTGLKEIPSQLSKLEKLEHVTLTHNHMTSASRDLSRLSNLRTLNLRDNDLTSGDISSEIFDKEELTTLDLSHNNLEEVPPGLENAKSLLVLNLSHNRLEVVPSQIFMNITELIYLDLSNNKLDSLPPQLRRLSNLQTLIINNNPLAHFQIRPLPSLTELKTLSLRNTNRSLNNIPSGLENLVHLTDVDLSINVLTKVPESLYEIPNIKRLNLSDNNIVEVSSSIEVWTHLEFLQLSRNNIRSLPAALCKLTSIRQLYINENNLDFDGIPSGIGKLSALEVFSASDNHLEMIPESLCRCGSLKKLILARNKLITLPDAIHLTELTVLDLKDNPDLIMPPKPVELLKGSGVEFYNVDFSLQNQLRLAGASVPQSLVQQQPHKDPVARKLRLRRRNNQNDPDENQAKVLKGMKDIANVEKREDEDPANESIKAKKWNEALEKPSLNYSEFFDEDVGSFPGITIWEIENFLPNQIDDEDHGKFYEGDCYIVLQTFVDENQSVDWRIFFWIGEKATLDKRTCSAIHAVNLRNNLGADCRTVREEQGDESPDFLKLFDNDIEYMEGARTASGFYTVEEIEYTVRMYRLHAVGPMTHLESVEVDFASLDSHYVFLLDEGPNIYIWYGRNSKNVLKSKARLIAEKINKNERKNTSKLHLLAQDNETELFWNCISQECGRDKPKNLEFDTGIADFEPVKPRLYKVCLGMGYLELPQVEYNKALKQELLNTKNVYILDCITDLFVWIGKKSTRLVRAAALKLSSELFSMMVRPPFSLIHRIAEGTESQVFKSKFSGWDDVIAVDFTRVASSVQRTGADLQKWARQQETKVDLTALFTPRQPPMPDEEALQLAEEWNEDLEALESFVLEGKKFVRLPDDELGIFYSGDSYVFLCRYWVPVEVAPSEGGEAGREDEELIEEDFQCVVYFWQGRDASNMGWLTFTFSLQKKFESLFGEKLEVVRTHQMQESLKFMSHFKNGFVVRQGSRKAPPTTIPELYQIRSNVCRICTRCVQIKCDSQNLNSAFCFILKVPFDQDGDSGIVYVWIGGKAKEEEALLGEQIAKRLYANDSYSIQILEEGEEPNNFFWVGLGGKKPYDEDAEYMKHSRLFRCSNEKGYFVVSEKCSDFCQDDLADDDIMLLDNGEQVFLWMGSRCSEVEVKLAYKSAQVYIQNMRAKQNENPRKLFATLKGKESRRFTKCFHGWGAFKQTLA